MARKKQMHPDVIWHGGMLRSKYPQESRAAGTKLAAEFDMAIRKGVQALEDGTCEFVPDMEPIPNAAVEAFDIFDVTSGDYLLIWRIPCRERRPN